MTSASVGADVSNPPTVGAAVVSSTGVGVGTTVGDDVSNAPMVGAVVVSSTGGVVGTTVSTSDKVGAMVVATVETMSGTVGAIVLAIVGVTVPAVGAKVTPASVGEAVAATTSSVAFSVGDKVPVGANVSASHNS